MKSAIDYLLDNLFYKDLNTEAWESAVKTAREMERQSIIDAVTWFDDTDRTPRRIKKDVLRYLDYCDKVNALENSPIYLAPHKEEFYNER